MTPTLRRSHRIMWLGLAILLPIGFVAALRLNTIPPVQVQPIGLPLAASLPVLIKSINNPGLQVNLRRDRKSAERQLEIIVRQPLEVPSVVVRVGDAGGQAIGQLDVAGVYRFSLPDSSAYPTITLTDEVHHSTLQTIHF
ncbi:hypothetical protein [Spirosoma areae]